LLVTGAHLLELRPLGHRHIIVPGEKDEEELAAAMASAAPAMLVATVVMVAVTAVVVIVDVGGKENKLKDNDEEMDGLLWRRAGCGGFTASSGAFGGGLCGTPAMITSTGDFSTGWAGKCSPGWGRYEEGGRLLVH
jgi:hypothetical protein